MMGCFLLKVFVNYYTEFEIPNSSYLTAQHLLFGAIGKHNKTFELVTDLNGANSGRSAGVDEVTLMEFEESGGIYNDVIERENHVFGEAMLDTLPIFQ
jgi:hypothetical protein